MIYHLMELKADFFNSTARGSICIYLVSLLILCSAFGVKSIFIIINGIGVYVIIRGFQHASHRGVILVIVSLQIVSYIFVTTSVNLVII